VHVKVNKEAHTTPTYKRKESLKSLFGPHDKTNTFGRSFASTRMRNETYLSSSLTPFLQAFACAVSRTTSHISLSMFHGTYLHWVVFIVKIFTHHYSSEALCTCWRGEGSSRCSHSPRNVRFGVLSLLGARNFLLTYPDRIRAHPASCAWVKFKGFSSPVTGLNWPRGWIEV
jgi:hypothetical protein